MCVCVVPKLKVYQVPDCHFCIKHKILYVATRTIMKPNPSLGRKQLVPNAWAESSFPRNIFYTPLRC